MGDEMQYQQILAEFAPLLTYPEAGTVDLAARLAARLAAVEPGAAEAICAFQEYLAGAGLARAREEYTRAFDLSPAAVPYLSVYLFGAENPRRGQFMAGLNGAYREAGHETGGELPDHLAVVLGYGAVADGAAWDELCRLCLPTPIRHMRQALEKASSPYLHVLTALDLLLKHAAAREVIHA